ncbi:MAG: hypothetical protein KKE30_07045 [Gammaproteobacteria bacterium]|nr:hypothetical protein [Gammaproteobacteria bacterium]MBU2071550.1 hypothetical protein [Gammaproteobacteria bacterium]
MAVPVQILRQNSQTMNTAMNIKTMLADFLLFVTSKSMYKTRLLAVGAAGQIAADFDRLKQCLYRKTPSYP